MDGRIIDVDQPSRLVWEGGVPGQFFGRHSFVIASDQKAGTRVTSSETFSGALAPAVVEEHRSTIEAEFSQFLVELKVRCEQASRPTGKNV